MRLRSDIAMAAVARVTKAMMTKLIMRRCRPCGHAQGYAESVARRVSGGTRRRRRCNMPSCVAIRSWRDARAEFATHQDKRPHDQHDGDGPAGDLQRAG